MYSLPPTPSETAKILTAFLTAGTGPVPITSGGTPAAAWATIRARGFKFRLAAESEDIKTTAAAPSFKPDDDKKEKVN